MSDPTPSVLPRRSLLKTVSMVMAAGVASALGAFVALRRTPPAPAPDAAVAGFWTLSLPDSKGQPLAMRSFAGQPLVVNFWATWCPPCVEEMPELSALHAELRPTGIQFLGIAIDSPKQVEAFSSRIPVSYPLVVAGMNGTELGRQFGNASGMLPFTVLIDQHGRILQRIPGRVRLPDLRIGIEALRQA